MYNASCSLTKTVLTIFALCLFFWHINCLMPNQMFMHCFVSCTVRLVCLSVFILKKVYYTGRLISRSYVTLHPRNRHFRSREIDRFFCNQVMCCDALERVRRECGVQQTTGKTINKFSRCLCALQISSMKYLFWSRSREIETKSKYWDKKIITSQRKRPIRL